MNPLFIEKMVTADLQDDVGTGDITAQLIPEQTQATAQVITREAGIICGVAWVNEVFRQVDPRVSLQWSVKDADAIQPNQVLFRLIGPARGIVTGERCALNWLQTLSGTATVAHDYAAALAGTQTQLLDTRKTIPGLRMAQKYAMRCGGGQNHRLGLFDAYLIKENHIASCGSIAAAVAQARAQHPEKPVEVEVENVLELQQAIDAKADIVMLDDFSAADMQAAVQLNQKRVKLEVSGGVDLETIREIAQLGVDYISVGALTKHVRAIDLSLRILEMQK